MQAPQKHPQAHQERNDWPQHYPQHLPLSVMLPAENKSLSKHLRKKGAELWGQERCPQCKTVEREARVPVPPQSIVACLKLDSTTTTIAYSLAALLFFTFHFPKVIYSHIKHTIHICLEKDIRATGVNSNIITRKQRWRLNITVVYSNPALYCPWNSIVINNKTDDNDEYDP